jgi:CubicO group peptidase (beta-lactamase class C family)
VSTETFGHFGATGTFLWVDPARDLACACLSARDFGDWARQAWPRLSDDVVTAYAAAAGPSPARGAAST